MVGGYTPRAWLAWVTSQRAPGAHRYARLIQDLTLVLDHHCCGMVHQCGHSSCMMVDSRTLTRSTPIPNPTFNYFQGIMHDESANRTWWRQTPGSAIRSSCTILTILQDYGQPPDPHVFQRNEGLAIGWHAMPEEYTKPSPKDSVGFDKPAGSWRRTLGSSSHTMQGSSIS